MGIRSLMKRRKQSAVRFFLVALVFYGWTRLEGKEFPRSIRLAYRPEAGTCTNYEMAVEASAKLVGREEEIYPSVPQESKTFGSFLFSHKVLDITSGGNIREELTYTDAKLEMEIAGKRQSLDFADRLKGKTILMEIGRDGRTISVKGLEEFSEELRDLGIRDMYIQMRPMFPDRELKVGDSWDNRTESALPIGDMLVRTQVDQRYTISGFEEKGGNLCVLIGTNIEINTTGKTLKKGEFDTDIDMEGKGDGEILYSFEDSRVISSRMGIDLRSWIRSSAYREVREIEMEHRVELLLEERRGGK